MVLFATPCKNKASNIMETKLKKTLVRFSTDSDGVPAVNFSLLRTVQPKLYCCENCMCLCNSHFGQIVNLRLSLYVISKYVLSYWDVLYDVILNNDILGTSSQDIFKNVNMNLLSCGSRNKYNLEGAQHVTTGVNFCNY